MSSFDDRKRGAEARYAMDEATEFKVMARRNKLLGLWIAEQMDLVGDEADAYAKTVVLADLEEPGDEDVFRKVQADIAAKSLNISDDLLRERMAELIPVARDQITGETD
ncbi:MAG: DUF1476 domain-containing protein [Pseudomonadota bacterium]